MDNYRHKIPIKDRWQPSERPRASSTGRIRATTRTGATSIVQDIYDRLGLKREDLSNTKSSASTTRMMIQRTASLDESAKVLDTQDSNATEPKAPPQRRLSALKSRWPPSKNKGAETATPPVVDTPPTSSKRTTVAVAAPSPRRSTISTTTTESPARTTEPIVVPASPGGSLLKFHSLSPALRKRLEQRAGVQTFESQQPEETVTTTTNPPTSRGTATQSNAPPTTIDCWEDEKKEDDMMVRTSSSIKDRLRAYKSTTTPRQIATFRERPPLIDIYSGSVTSEPQQQPSTVEQSTPTAHNRSASGVASAFLAAIHQTTPRSTYVPDTILPDAHSETESVSMLSSTSDPPCEPSPKASRTAPTTNMHKKIQWLEQRATAPRQTTVEQAPAPKSKLPADWERLVDERVKLKVAEVEHKLEERLRNYIHELHNRRNGM